MENNYGRPPITEAVVEFRLLAPVDANLVQRIGTSFNSFYPRSEDLQEIEFQIGPAGAQTRRTGLVGFKRTNVDANEIVVIKAGSLNIAQLAPYPGWDHFIERVRRDWKLWRSKTNYRDLARIGVRFLNRIDIPHGAGEVTFVPKDYVLVGPAIPEAFGDLKAYHVNAVLRSEDLRADVTLNSGTVESPLLKHSSLLLDIDIGRIEDMPKKEDDIFEFLEAVRLEKNRLFEACLTEDSRKLFL
ncbi:MAG: TIGR04255 family protein [Rhizobiales bacterium]|nr:TIGR04255 family protein [Hyphomicrobiales bacterium]